VSPSVQTASVSRAAAVTHAQGLGRSHGQETLILKGHSRAVPVSPSVRTKAHRQRSLDNTAQALGRGHGPGNP